MHIAITGHWTSLTDMPNEHLEMASTAPLRLRLRYLVVSAAIAGTLDLAFAIVWAKWLYSVSPVMVLQIIASGVLGPGVIGGAWPSAAYGAILHYFIMGAFAALALWVSRRAHLTASLVIPAGIAYGAALFVLMNYLVVPLSFAPLPLRTSMHTIAPELLAHMALVGVPLVWLAHCESIGYWGRRAYQN